jgi:hypothetical protein
MKAILPFLPGNVASAGLAKVKIKPAIASGDERRLVLDLIAVLLFSLDGIS